MRSMLIRAFVALPFQMRQRNRSTSVMIIAFAASRAGSSCDSTPATCFRCCSRMAIWNQSSIGDAVTPVSARMRRSPGQPSVKAVSAVSPGPADGVEGVADQHPNVCVGLRDGAENLSSAGLCFDIADPDLEVPLAVLAAADEG